MSNLMHSRRNTPKHSCQSKGRQLRAPGFIGIGLSAVSSVSQPAVVTCNIEYSPPQSLIDRRVSFPTFIQLKICGGCWEFLIRTTRPACPLSPDTMRTLIIVLYGTGLRLGEATRLKHEDVDFRKTALTIRETKFGKSRLVPIGKDLVSILRLYRMRHRPGFGYERPPTLL